MMNNEELAELERLTLKAPEEATRFIDELVFEEQALRVALARGKAPEMPVLFKLPTQADSAFQQLQQVTAAPSAIGTLAALAGLRDAARKVRKRDERGQLQTRPDPSPLPDCWPRKPPLRQTEAAEFWLALESTQPSESVVERAKALLTLAVHLRLQRRSLASRSGFRLAWLQEVTHQGLAELLLEHPVLMHPRLFFQAVGQSEMAPMAHCLLAFTDMALPSSLHGFKEGALRAFAASPSVVMALTVKPAQLYKASDTRLQGRRVLDAVVHPETGLCYLFAASLMQLERLRVAGPGKRKGASFLKAPAGGSDEFINFLAAGFLQSWKSMDAADAHFFLEEMRLSPLAHGPSFAANVIQFSSRVLGDVKGTVSSPFQAVQAHDMRERIARMTYALHRAHVEGCDTPAATAQTLLRHIFPLPVDGDMKTSTIPPSIDGDGATVFINAMLEQGLAFEDVSERIRRSPNCGAAWVMVLDAEQARRTMSRVIEEQVLPPMVSEEPAQTRRRMRL